MKTMTIREVAELCEVDTKTVRRWVDTVSRGDGHDIRPRPEIKAKTAEAGEKGEAAKLAIDEVLAIIRAGGKKTLATLLEQNAKEKEAPRARTINGPFLAELRRIYGPSEAARRLDFLIGYRNIFAPRETTPKASPAVAERAFPRLLAIAERGPAQPELGVQR